MNVNLDDLFKEIDKEKQDEINENSKVLLVDGLNNYMRAFSVNSTMNDDGLHIGGITGFFNTVNAAIRLISPTRCIIIFDGKGGSTARRKIYKEYKTNRRGLRVRLNRTYDFESGSEEEQNATRQLVRLADYLDTLPITTLIYDNIEADDVIGYLAKDLFKQQVVIMSTDKDFIQLIDDRISIYNAPRKKVYHYDNVKEDYDFISSNYLLYRLISGDASDGIPGVKGVGIKGIQKSLGIICGDKPIEFRDFLKYINDNKDKDNVLKKMYKYKDKLIRNYTLMKLGELEISGSTKSNIRELISLPISMINNLQIRKLFLNDKLYSAIPNINSWLKLNFNKLNAFALKTQG